MAEEARAELQSKLATLEEQKHAIELKLDEHMQDSKKQLEEMQLESEKQLKEKEEKLSAANAKLDEMCAKADEYQEMIEKRGAEFEALQMDLAQRQEISSGLEHAKAELVSAAEKHASAVRGLEKEIADNKSQHEDAMKDAQREKALEISELTKRFKAKEAEVVGLKAEIESLRSRIQESAQRPAHEPTLAPQNVVEDTVDEDEGKEALACSEKLSEESRLKNVPMQNVESREQAAAPAVTRDENVVAESESQVLCLSSDDEEQVEERRPTRRSTRAPAATKAMTQRATRVTRSSGRRPLADIQTTAETEATEAPPTT